MNINRNQGDSVETYKNAFEGVFNGLTVLVTGHTGFKGSWLSIWLNELGARVIGYSLDPPTVENNFNLTNLNKKFIDIRGDVNDLNALTETIKKYKPQVVFHLAAQPIYNIGFEYPRETFYTNVGGTINVLEAIRKTDCVKVLVCITSDKCYRNQELVWGYRETDLLGGDNPYSASKGMAELAIQAYRTSFFKDKVAIASVRAGNVIGGGDFRESRLVPDSILALINNNPVVIRNPDSVRPWQHVLVPLSGYLWLASLMLKNNLKYNEAWNFGPLEYKAVTTKYLVEKLIEFWGNGSWVHDNSSGENSETKLLKLNWEKAAKILNWYPAYTIEDALKETVNWFKEYQKNKSGQQVDMYQICVSQIKLYTERARELDLEWSKS